MDALLLANEMHSEPTGLLGVVVTGDTLTNENGHVSPPVLSITSRVKHVVPIQLDDFLFLKEQAKSAIPKVCIPSPTMAHFRGGRAAISVEVYPDVRNYPYQALPNNAVADTHALKFEVE